MRVKESQKALRLFAEQHRPAAWKPRRTPPLMTNASGSLKQTVAIRAPSRGALDVDGGPGTGNREPGTGKTAVALHRSACFLHSDPRVGHRGAQGKSGVLVIGPHRRYLTYVADVFPSLGEEGVQTYTLRDLVPEGASAAIEEVPDVALLKSSADMVKAIKPAVRFYEEPPAQAVEVETPYVDRWLSVDEWAQAFEAPSPGTPHNEARDESSRPRRRPKAVTATRRSQSAQVQSRGSASGGLNIALCGSKHPGRVPEWLPLLQSPGATGGGPCCRGPQSGSGPESERGGNHGAGARTPGQKLRGAVPTSSKRRARSTRQ
ncbi:hypothetical protein NicSoilB8_23810 [Arthrobacter sp. NicSoilB8]|nr:hypothetical protein NicSoilB8_23810 [Arthrobacter sp. NicSoilB8]